MRFGNWLACQYANLNGANELLFVRRCDFLGRFRVESLQNTMQMAGRVFFSARPQPPTEFFRAQRNVREAFQQHAQVQSRPDSEDRQAFPVSQVLQCGQCQLAIATCSCFVFRIENVDQVMRNAAAFGCVGFCRTYVKPAIELRGIAGHHFPAEPLGQPYAERGLARCRWTNDGHERQKGVFSAHRTRRCRARTRMKMSTKRARRRLPRTCWRVSFTDKPLRSANCTGNKTAARYRDR